MQLDKENMKKIRWLIAFAILLYLGVQHGLRLLPGAGFSASPAGSLQMQSFLFEMQKKDF